MSHSLKQIRALVAVGEEGSFTAAARRENATQSGISQHVATLEASLGVALVERSREGVTLTRAGQRFYQHCTEALRALESGSQAVAELSEEVAGEVHVGLMPAFTRAALAPALDSYAARYPNVSVRVTEAYSGALTDMVRAGEIDCALVPAAAPAVGLRVELLSRDRELLVSSPTFGLRALEPVTLNELDPIKLIVPGVGNVRRRNLEAYLETHSVKVSRRLEMDAMLGTLEMVARTDWVTILPGLICIADRDCSVRCLNPLTRPALFAEYVLLQPARSPLSQPAALFVQAIREEVERIGTQWDKLLDAARA
ncbi:MAG: LysR family transcriptional regulator [Burkholderiaceae bacterium]